MLPSRTEDFMSAERVIWPSLEAANRIADLANIVFVCSLVIGLIATCIIIWMANVKEAHWDVAREASQMRITELNKETEQAKAESAKANLEIERIKAPRSISPEARTEILASLAPFKGEHIAVGLNGQDPESITFAEQLLGVVEASGWTMQRTVWPDALAVAGIEVQTIKGASDKSLAAAGALISSLRSAGLSVSGPKEIEVGNPTFFVYLVIGRNP
jgi:hypothetical protein